MSAIQLKAALLFFLFAVVSCSGGGGSSTTENPGEEVTPDPVDTELPVANIVFPASSGLWSETATVFIRGTASDNDALTAIRVNGVDATSNDGFSTWTVEVPLEAGTENTITVEAEDVSGNVASEAAQLAINTYPDFDSNQFCSPTVHDPVNNKAVTFYPPRQYDLSSGESSYLDPKWSDITGAAYDPVTGGYLLAKNDELISVDADFNLLAEIPSDDALTLGVHQQIATNEVSGQIYVLAMPELPRGPDDVELIKVDRESGRRSRVVIRDTSGQWVENRVPGIVVDSGRVFLLTENTLYELTANHNTDYLATEISGATVGAGEAITYAGGLTVNVRDGKAHIGDFYNKLVEINLANGDRTVLSTPETGAESNLNIEWLEHGLVATEDTLLANSCLTGHLLKVDKTTGNRAFLSEKRRGEGPVLSRVAEFRFDEFREQLILTNDVYDVVGRGYFWETTATDQVITVDPVSGDRTIVAKSFDAAAPVPGLFMSITINPANGTVYAVHLGYNYRDTAILSLVPDTNNWTPVLQASAGSSDALQWIRGITWDPTTEKLLITAEMSASDMCLLRVDPATGAQENLSCKGDLAGDWEYPWNIAVDADSEKAYVSDFYNGIFEVELATGAKRLLIGAIEGSGPEITGFGRIVKDDAGGRLLVSASHVSDDTGRGEQLRGELIAIDLVTGEPSTLLVVDRRNDETAFANPAINPDTGEIYLSLPNRAIAVLDRETNQHLIISQ